MSLETLGRHSNCIRHRSLVSSELFTDFRERSVAKEMGRGTSRTKDNLVLSFSPKKNVHGHWRWIRALRISWSLVHSSVYVNNALCQSIQNTHAFTERNNFTFSVSISLSLIRTQDITCSQILVHRAGASLSGTLATQADFVRRCRCLATCAHARGGSDGSATSITGLWQFYMADDDDRGIENIS